MSNIMDAIITERHAIGKRDITSGGSTDERAPAIVYFTATWRDRVGALLEERGMTQEEMGKKLGVGQSTISHWLAGRREPNRIDDFERMAVALSTRDRRVTAAYILYGIPGDLETFRAMVREEAQRMLLDAAIPKKADKENQGRPMYWAPDRRPGEFRESYKEQTTPKATRKKRMGR